MNTQAKLLNENRKKAIADLQKYFRSKKWTDKIEKKGYKADSDIGMITIKQMGYQQGFREAITIAVNLMFDKNYQDLGTKELNLIEKILQDN